MNNKDGRGFTPLMIAAQAAPGKTTINQPKPPSNIVAALIAFGADKDATNNEGVTALGCFYASTRSYNDVSSTFGGRVHKVDPTLRLMLMPTGGPTAADQEAQGDP